MTIPNYKDIIELLKKGMTLEAQEKIMELREAALEIQEENFSLRQKIQQLEGELHRSKNLIFKSNVYWLSEDGRQKDGPFCPHCKDDKDKLIRLRIGTNQGHAWECPICFYYFDQHKLD